MASTRELFAPDNPVDLFVLSMSMARNDIRHALHLVGKANDDDQPEFGYLVRVALGHFFDASQALKLWRQESEEVRAFLSRLPASGRQALKTAVSTDQQLGTGALQHSRVSTFHYPAPNPSYKEASSADALSDAVRELGGEPAAIVVLDGGKRFRLGFADDVALVLAMQKFEHADRDSFKAQQDRAMRGATSFVNFVDVLLVVFMEDRNLGLDVAESD